MHEQALKLEALWREDQARDLLLRERKGLDDRLQQARKGAAEANARREEAAASLAALTREETELTSKLNNYIKRRDQAQTLIDTGRAPDFTIALNQVRQCSEAIDSAENALLALFDQVDAAKLALEAARNAAGLMALRVTEAEAALQASAAPLDEQIATASAAVKAARVGIEREHLGRYDGLRSRGISAFAEVRAGACCGCNVKINSLLLAEHRRGVAVAACNSCGRFLGTLV